MTVDDNTPIACDLTQIPPDERTIHARVTSPALLGMIDEARAIDNGYALRLSSAPEALMTAARFIDNERRCCPFFAFGLDIAPNGGAVWLRVTVVKSG